MDVCPDDLHVVLADLLAVLLQLSISPLQLLDLLRELGLETSSVAPGLVAGVDVGRREVGARLVE